MTAINGAGLVVGGFSLEDRRAVPVGDDVPPFEGWFEAVQACRFMEKHSAIWLGDLLNYGEANYGEKYTQALTATGLAYQTLANVASVAHRVDFSRRRDVPFGHLEAVAKLEPEDQTRWLESAVTQSLSRNVLREQIKQEQGVPPGAAPKLWVVVACTDARDQAELCNRMTAEGRAVKLKAG